MILDRLIVIDHVSGLADRSEDFANFFKKIRTEVCVHFPYYISDKTALADDTVIDKKYLIFSQDQ